jgi:hypothetical protein
MGVMPNAARTPRDRFRMSEPCPVEAVGGAVEVPGLVALDCAGLLCDEAGTDFETKWLANDVLGGGKMRSEATAGVLRMSSTECLDDPPEWG